MSKKITVTLSDKAEQQLAEIMYSLDDGCGVPSQSKAISYALEVLADFEKEMEMDIITFLSDKIEQSELYKTQ